MLNPTDSPNRRMLKLLDSALDMCEEAYEDGATTLSLGLLQRLNDYVKVIGLGELTVKVGDQIFMAADEILLWQEQYVIPWKTPKRGRKNRSSKITTP